MLKLIVNGDDFGINQQVNNAIIKSFSNGILRSTSLMANGNSFPEAVKLIKDYPDLDVGVHLTLVGEKPISNPNKLPSLLDKNGFLPSHASDFIQKYIFNKISLNEIRIELMQQITKILDYSIPLTHLDSHQHIHMLPSILELAIELSKKYNIRFIRFPNEKFQLYLLKKSKSITTAIQMFLLNQLCRKAVGKKFLRTDYFSGFYYGGRLSKENFLSLISHLPNNGACELMCHPGLLNGPRKKNDSYYLKIEEMYALIDSEVLEFLKKKNIEVTAFKDLIK